MNPENSYHFFFQDTVSSGRAEKQVSVSNDTCQTPLDFGIIDQHHPLTIISHMTDNGVIFSDGI